MTMNRWIVLGAAILTVAWLTGAGAGQPPGDRPTAPPPDGGGRPTAPPPDGQVRPPGYNPASQPAVVLNFTGEYEEMVRELKLNANQQKFIATVVRDEEKALANFDRDNKKQLEDLNKNLEAFNKRLSDPNRYNADANNARTIIQQRIALVATRREALARNFKVRATATLTPDQKTTWIALKLNRILTDELLPIGLSAEQQAAVKAICDRQAKTATKVDVAADLELQGAVRQQVNAAVLDDQQRARYGEVLRQRQANKAP